MKFHTLALAATLAFSGAAFAAPNDPAPAPVKRNVTHVVKVKPHAGKHAKRHHGKAVHHAAAMKHHEAMHGAHRQQGQDHMTAPASDMNSGSRAARMDEALQKFRASRG